MYDGKVQGALSRADKETVTLGENGRFSEEVTFKLRHDGVEATQEVGWGDGEPSGHGGQNHESLEKSDVGGTETASGMDLLGRRWHGGK